MEPIKNSKKVKMMFSRGQTTLVDVSTGYKYSMTACCPKDGSFSSIAQTEISGQSLSRIVFKCPTCFNLFEAKQEEIFLR
jgi:hypothetical protein